LKKSTVASLPPEIAVSALLRKGDLLIAAVGATYGKSYLHIDDTQTACFAGFLVRVSPGPAVSPDFLSYWAMSDHYWNQVSRNVIQSTIQNFSASRVKRLRVLVPPADEQAAIVKYLGHAHARIDRAIAAKRKLIALLEEQKQAIIHQAVTRGLDPNVPLKDSGVPWLGEIPVHWVIERVKYVLREVDDRSTSGNEEQLSVSHLTGVSPRKATVTMFRAESYVGHKVCQPGDLVVNTMWAWMGALGVARDTGIVSPSYGVYRLKGQKKMRSDFLDLTLRTPGYISYFKSKSTGIRSSRLRLYPDQVLSTPVPIPPISEQASIVDYLVSRGNEFDRIRAGALAEIELLREFRTRLTSDVVTGQVDVREIAASLPDLADEVLVGADNEFTDDDHGDESIESELEIAGANE
jgi:type I restriction enzyme S subunit